MNPLVSVMVVVKGRAEHLEETLLSLLGQTLQDFEIIVVDGGVDEAARQMLARYSSDDERIKVFEQEEAGISAARNQAMSLASGKYCAVADADDISLPHRLERQVDFLDAHPEISLCGAWIQTFGVGTSQIRQTPPDDASIRAQMMFLCPFAHSTVAWRREDVARTGQKYRLHSSEDYDLWARLLPHICFANLPEVLVRYRVHEGQRSHVVEETERNWKYQVAIRSSLVRQLGIAPTDAEAALHQKISTGREDEVWLDDVEAWLLELRNANHARRWLPTSSFDKVIAERWWVASLRAKSKSFRIRRFLASPLISGVYPGVWSKIGILLSYTKHLLADRIRRMSG
ncbi:MAG: glycosyltransferase [Chloroflexota bacterium]